MRIQYCPVIDIGPIVHRNSVVLEKRYPGISEWAPGEIKDVASDLGYRENRDGDANVVNLCADLLQSRMFAEVKDDGTTENLNFVCSRCGAATAEDSLPHPKTGALIPIEIEDERVCKACFDSAISKLTPTGFEFKPLEDDK